ncbi:hypothetical protein GDO86_012078 [Hymenochirus boettgeri]|uniref:Uncharacterized protein n=1 Tax=Hymenochirus boettgeri TaxID=247094 RepID=A0A8T2JDZ2_9PIPI|nr:hypothetical protein GDO86_012078 [Hymenochirus boettgeri]
MDRQIYFTTTPRIPLPIKGAWEMEPFNILIDGWLPLLYKIFLTVEDVHIRIKIALDLAAGSFGSQM